MVVALTVWAGGTVPSFAGSVQPQYAPIYAHVPPRTAPIGGNDKPVTELDAYILGHDYLTAGVTLRGPLKMLYDMLRIVVLQGGKTPNLSVSYLSQRADGKTDLLRFQSFAGLENFIQERNAVRKSLATEIARRGEVVLPPLVKIKAVACDGTGWKSGLLHTAKHDRDYNLSQDENEAIAVAFGGTMTFIAITGAPIKMFGKIIGNGVSLDQVGGNCKISFTLHDLPDGPGLAPKPEPHPDVIGLPETIPTIPPA